MILHIYEFIAIAIAVITLVGVVAGIVTKSDGGYGL